MLENSTKQKNSVFFAKNIEKYLLIKNKALPLHRS
jgi:hypothetical protein